MAFNYLEAHLICLQGKQITCKKGNPDKMVEKRMAQNNKKENNMKKKTYSNGFVVGKIPSHIWLERKSSLIATEVEMERE